MAAKISKTKERIMKKEKSVPTEPRSRKPHEIELPAAKVTPAALMG